MNITNKPKILISSALAACTALAAVAHAAPDEGESDNKDEAELPEALDVTEEEKWTIFEYIGPEYDYTLADLFEGEGSDPKYELKDAQARVRADVELQHMGQTVVLTDLDAEEGEAEAVEEERNALQELIDVILFLLRLAGELEQEAPNFALNGIYDGVLTSENGSSTDAVMRFTQHYGNVTGTLVVTDADMTLDAGCTVLEVPVSSFDFGASTTTPSPGYAVEVEAQIQRRLRIGVILGSVDVDANVDMRFQLDDNFDILEADFEMSSSWPCSDTMASGYFIRRPGTSPFD